MWLIFNMLCNWHEVYVKEATVAPDIYIQKDWKIVVEVQSAVLELINNYKENDIPKMA